MKFNYLNQLDGNLHSHVSLETLGEMRTLIFNEESKFLI